MNIKAWMRFVCCTALPRQLNGESSLIECAIRDQHLERLRAEIHPEWAGPVKIRLEIRRGDVVSEIARYAEESVGPI